MMCLQKLSCYLQIYVSAFDKVTQMQLQKRPAVPDVL